MMKTDSVLICLSGWGSRCEIFDSLIDRSPLLRQRRRVELQWQDFVGLNAARRAEALYSAASRFLPLRSGQTADVILLGWSLGCLLSLELALQLQQKQNSENPKNPSCRLWLVLLAATATMCPPAGGAKDSDSEYSGQYPSEYPSVAPIALKVMQRKLQQPQNTVLLDFAANCLAPGQAGEPFVAEYLQQAESVELQHLQQGLEYLLQCDLRQHLQQTPLSCPALLLSGQRDAIIPFGQSEALAQQISGSQLHGFAAGHNLLVPPPGNMPQIIAKFLTATATV